MEPMKKYNGLNVPPDYFTEAMDKLVNRFLNITLDAVLHPLSSNAKRGAEIQKVAIMKIARVTEDELSSGIGFERGYQHNKAKEYDYAIYCYTEAIRLKPDYASAYNNRGLAHYEKGDLDAAIKDYNETIRLKPDHARAFNNSRQFLYAKG